MKRASDLPARRANRKRAPSNSPAAIRQRRRRERERAGLIVLKLEVDEQELSEALFEAGLLPSCLIDDREEVIAAARRAKIKFER